jgi:hypothetical protein
LFGYFLTAPWNHIFLGEVKNGGCDEAIENCSIGEHPAVLTNNNLLANKSIYCPSPPLASESKQNLQGFPHFCILFPPLHTSTPSLRTTFTAATKIIDIRGRSSMDAQRDGDVSRPGEGSPLLQTQQRENHSHNPDLEKPNSKYTTYAVALGVLLA